MQLSIAGWHPMENSDMMTALELAFSTKSLRQLCESGAKAKRVLGFSVALKLRRRLADMRAATCVKDLVAGQPRELENPGRRNIVVGLCKGFRIVFCANHNVVPVLNSGGVDWAKVSRVKILRVESDDA